MKWRKGRQLRLFRYLSLSKLERLEDDARALVSGSLSVLGSGLSAAFNRSPGLQSRVNRVEKTLRRQKLLGALSDPESGAQFLLCELYAKEFVAQGVAVWIAKLENGYLVTGGSATYLDRNIDVFTSKGVIPGSNISSYYAALGAIYRQTLDRAGNTLNVRPSTVATYPANAEGGSYHAEDDAHCPKRSNIWRIEPQDEVTTKSMNFEEVFRVADKIQHRACDPWGGEVRQLVLVHADHTLEVSYSNAPNEVVRVVVGSPLYVEQLGPSRNQGPWLAPIGRLHDLTTEEPSDA